MDASDYLGLQQQRPNTLVHYSPPLASKAAVHACVQYPPKQSDHATAATSDTFARSAAADHMQSEQRAAAGQFTATAPACAAEPTTKPAAVEHGELEGLMHQLQEGNDQQLQLQAARAVGQLAMQGPDHQAAVAAAGFINPLLNLLTNSSNEQLQGYCALALGKLALHNPDMQQALADAGAVKPLVDLMVHSSSNDAGGCAVLAVASLAWRNSSLSAAIAAAGAIPHIVQFFNSTSTTEVHGHAAQALGNLAGANGSAAVKVIAAGGVDCLLQLLGSHCGSAAAKEKALRALRSLITTSAYCDVAAAASADMIPAVVKLALEHSRNNGSSTARSNRSHSSRSGSCIQEAAEDVLQLLVQMSASNAASVIMADGFACMPFLLNSSSSSTTVCKHTALGIAQVAAQHPQKALSLVHAGVIPSLLHLLGNAGAAVQEAAAAAVGSLASSNIDVQVALIDAGAVSQIVALIRRDAAGGHTSNVKPTVAALEWAAYAIAHTCKISKQVQSSFVTAGALEPLVQLLNIQDAQQTAACALGNLCANNAEIQKAAIAAGAAPLLVRLLGQQQPADLQKSAAAALGNLAAGGAEVSLALAAAGAVDQLIALLLSTSKSSTAVDSSNGTSRLEVLDWAIYALGHFAKKSPSIQETVANSGAVVVLVQLLQGDSTPALQQSTACALVNLATGQQEIQDQITDAGGIAALAQLLDLQHCFAVQSSAAAALWELVKQSPYNSMVLAAAGGIHSFVKMLTCDGAIAERLEVHEWAKHVLSSLAESDYQQIQAEMFAAGTILPLQQLATRQTPDGFRSSLTLVDDNSGNCNPAERQQHHWRQTKMHAAQSRSCSNSGDDVKGLDKSDETAMQQQHKQHPQKHWKHGASRWQFAGATVKLTQHQHKHRQDQHLNQRLHESAGAVKPVTPHIVQSRSKSAACKDGEYLQQQLQQSNKPPFKPTGRVPNPLWLRTSRQVDILDSTGDQDVMRCTTESQECCQ